MTCAELLADFETCWQYQFARHSQPDFWISETIARDAIYRKPAAERVKHYLQKGNEEIAKAVNWLLGEGIRDRVTSEKPADDLQELDRQMGNMLSFLRAVAASRGEYQYPSLPHS